MTTEKEQALSVIHVRVPKELKDRLDEIAKTDRRTLAVTVQIALEQLVQQRERETGKKR